eukprot:g14094.t1
MEGLGCDETYNASTRELWAHLGPSQVRFKEGSSSTSWPGEIRIWVEDIRSVADMLNMLGRTLDTKIVEEMREARTGGEYAALLHDPGLKNKIEASEAPGGWSAALRQIPIGLSAQAKKKNALAISDAVVHLPTRTQIQGVARFYDHYIGSAITKKYAVYEALGTQMPVAPEKVDEPGPAPPAEAVPAPAPEATEGEGGLLGRLREKVAPTVQRVAEMESVQKGYERIKEVSHRVAENERVQQGVEKVQKGLEVAKEKGKVVMEKTQQGIEAVKEKTREWRAGAGTVWEQGRGSIQRIRTEGVSALAWRGSAKDTLAMEEQWKDIKVQGAEELSVPARTEHTCAYHVSKGSTLRWTFRVKDHDIGFAVRMRVQVWGGAQEEEAKSGVCIYMKDHGQFHLAYAKCKTSDLLSIECSKKSWEEIESQKEFLITGVMDPQDHSMVLRLPHILSSLAAAFKPPGAKGGPWIYTTSTPNYTKALMRHVDPGGKVFAMRVLTRDQCTPCQVPGFFLKDMSLIRSKMDGDDSNSLQRRILVDNNPVSCVLHPSGSVLVRDWLGDAEEDQELERLQKLLEALLQDSQGDYAARLAQMTRGFQSWRTRLKALGELLEKTPPSEADGLRSIFRDVSRECNDMKRELLGAAP